MYIKVKVITDSKEEKLERLKEDAFRIWVKAPAERGLANSKVKEILSHFFKTSNIRLISGHTSPAKIFSVGD
ncbi:MAG: uncharacterized protein QG614_18 [Patescibacteria group bacterium]|nr:uncharacterized protein [Patescibacteria group bacterium]